MKRKSRAGLALLGSLAITGAIAPKANAGPITGGLSIDGTATDNTTKDILTFTGLGNVGAGTATGSYKSAFEPGCNGCVSFSNGGFNYSGKAGDQEFFVATQNGKTADFTETAITRVVDLPKGVVDIYVNGEASLTGFTNTAFTGELTIQGNGNTTFSASEQSKPSPVPEPGSLELTLTGAVMIAGAMSLKRPKKSVPAANLK